MRCFSREKITSMLKLPRSHYEALRKHGEKRYPEEACGALLGKMQDGERVVHEVVHCKNAREGFPQNRYGIAPAELIAAQKRAPELGLNLIAVYLSDSASSSSC